MKRYATAVWNGQVKDGKGTLSTQSNTLKNTPYSFKSRFDEGIGTNPEELIAAAHAGCFSMKLSANFTAAGLTPQQIETKATINLNAEKGEVDTIHLEVAVKAEIDQEQFDKLVEDAKINCPISKLLKAQITVDAKLN